MTSNGWLQITLFIAIVIAVTRPFDGHMTRVFAGERRFLTPLLRPVERFVYWCCGVNEADEQPWRTYAVSMLFFGVAGFVTLYVLARWRGSPYTTSSRPPAGGDEPRYSLSGSLIVRRRGNLSSLPKLSPSLI